MSLQSHETSPLQACTIRLDGVKMA